MNRKRHIFANLCLISATVGVVLYSLLAVASFILAMVGLNSIWPIVVIVLVVLSVASIMVCMYNNCCKKFKEQKKLESTQH